jgi:hypothetical protein
VAKTLAFTFEVGKHVIVGKEYVTTMTCTVPKLTFAFTFTFTFAFAPHEVSGAFVDSANFAHSLAREAPPLALGMAVGHEHMIRRRTWRHIANVFVVDVFCAAIARGIGIGSGIKGVGIVHLLVGVVC